MNRRDKEDAQRFVKPFAGFREFVLDGLRVASEGQIHFRPQVWWLADESGKVVADFVGRYEVLGEDFERLRVRLGWPEMELKQDNRTKHRPGVDVYDVEVAEAVAEVYEEDFRVFGYEAGVAHGW